MEKQTVILKPLPPPPSQWKQAWWWLTNAEYRAEQSYVHPALFLWRCLMFPFVVAALVIYCALVCVAFGTEQARRTFHDAY